MMDDDGEGRATPGRALLAPSNASPAYLTITADPEQVGAARRFVAEALGDHPDATTAALLTSELVTNSILHGPGGPVTVSVASSPGGSARVEVTDGGGQSVPHTRTGDNYDEQGRGLLLVSAMSDRWGYHPADSEGLTTWFEIGGEGASLPLPAGGPT
jgi:anti-sigma regulatory factor (Ser/Thr protein kinase)